MMPETGKIMQRAQYALPGQKNGLEAKASKSFQRVKKPSRQAILPQKHPGFRVIARPQRGRGNLKVKGMASRGEVREYETSRNAYCKKYEIRRFIPLNHISFRDDKSHR